METSNPTPGNSADNPIAVRTVGAEYAYLEAHPCACGGAWKAGLQGLVAGAQEGKFVDRLSVHCSGCGVESEFFFRVESTPEESEAELQALEDALQAMEKADTERALVAAINDEKLNPPLSPGHPLVGQPCPFCHQGFEVGDITKTVCSGPANEEELAKARKGLPYVLGPDMELHFDCGDPKGLVVG